jgi:hypothetical protein
MVNRKENVMAMKRWLLRAARLLALGCAMAACSCHSQEKAQPISPQPSPPQSQGATMGGGMTAVSYTPGEAGGRIEETVRGTVTVSAIDPATRKITLSTQDGAQATFTAPPEMRNFDQLRVDDKVDATLKEQLLIFVDRDGDRDPSVTHAAALARTPKGARPGAIVAEGFEIVATVQSIDTAKRQATLQFADGKSKTVPVRGDVDLAKYKPGDSVVIQITQHLMLLVQKP